MQVYVSYISRMANDTSARWNVKHLQTKGVKMTFSEFLDLLKNHKIDFEYDGWNHSGVLNYENHEYSFRIYLEEDEDDKNLKLPVLSSMNKHQKCVYWRIYVNDNKIYRQSRNGDDGKIREFPEVECEGKNIGRKNETRLC